MLLAQAVGFTFLLLLAMIVANAEGPQGISVRYVFTALQYWIFLYPIVLLMPCVVGEAIGRRVRNRSHPKSA